MNNSKHSRKKKIINAPLIFLLYFILYASIEKYFLNK